MYNKFVKYIYYPILQTIKGERVLDCLKSLEESQWYSRERLRNIQWQKLLNLLKFASKNIPYYRNLFLKIGLKVEDIKDYNDFLNVPLLTKETARNNKDKLLDSDYHGRFYRNRTSGSTGIALEVFHSIDLQSWDSASQWRAKRWFGVDIGDREASLWGRPIESRMERFIGPIKERFRNVLLLPAIDLSDEKLKVYYQSLKRFKPSLIYAYVSPIFQLVQYVRRAEKELPNWGCKVIVSTAEVLYKHQKEIIESTFGCKVAQQYGCGEVGMIARECPEGGLHLSCENIFVEFLNQGRPASAGESADIILTTLNNYYMPFIRYKIGDVGSYTDRICSCKRSLPLMEMQVAKLIGMLKTKEGRVFSGQLFEYINNALTAKGIKGIKQFRVIQNALDAFKVEVVKDEPFSQDSIGFFRQKMMNFLGNDIKVDFKFVKDILPERSGKIRYFISNPSPILSPQGRGAR